MDDTGDDTTDTKTERKLEKLRHRVRGFDNSMSVIMSNALKAANEIHIVNCSLRSSGHAASPILLNALHSVLIVAEQCRQEMTGPTTS